MKKSLLFLFCLFVLVHFGQAQFKKITKNTPTQDVAKLIGAGVTDKARLQNNPQTLRAEASILRDINSKISDLRITRDTDGTPLFIQGKLRDKNPTARQTPESQAKSYLNGLKSVLNIKNPEEEFLLKNDHSDELGQRHIMMQQSHRGLPVYGAEVMLHTGNDGEIEAMNGRFYPSSKIDNIKPKISENQVANLIKKDIGQHAIVRMMGGLEKKILNYDQPQASLIIYHPNQDPKAERLAWQVMIRPNFIERWQYIVDANTGEILLKYNHTCAIDGPAKATATDLNGVQRSIDTYSYKNKFYLMDATRTDPQGRAIFKSSQSSMPDDPIGVLWTIDASNSSVNDMTYRQLTTTNNVWNSPTAISAHYNGAVAYEYFKTKHGRTSLNGKGGTITSIINITDETGKGFDNAFWNGEFMGYGNGKDAFKPLAGGLDVAGHEMTHGVVENSANLEYNGQSGAINESMADIFGVMIDRNNWTIGEAVVKLGAFPSGALRDMANPNNGGSSLRDAGYQPRTMNQYYTGSMDNYGVHINSGIPNYAFFLFANNGSVGKDKAEKVYYRALTTYLTKTSKFLNLRLAVIKSCQDLYGNGAEATAAQQAFDAVGIVDNSTTPSPIPVPTTQTIPKEIPANTGTEFLLSYDPVLKNLYVSNTAPKTASDFRELIKNVTLSHKPSVTDDGKYAYFVPADGKIKRVNLTGTALVENISSDAVWDNVAISKDGKRLAALTKTADKAIYVFDLVANKSQKFILYNPTYTQGVQTGQVQYADGLEWDYSGESLVYDAINVLKNTDGSSAEYWDVGFLDVWNASTNAFGTGEVSKLFSSLDKGESIGNPSFSKTSPDIVAFDYYNESDGYSVLTANTETSKAYFVVANTGTGYPEYSRLDNKILYNTKKSNGKEYTTNIGIKTDKVSPNGTATDLIEDSKWAVWYTVGTRSTPTKTAQSISFAGIADKLEGEPAFNLAATASSGLPVSFILVSGPASLSGNRLTLTGIGKVEITAIQEGNASFSRALPVTVSFNVVKITATEQAILSEQISVWPNPAQSQIIANIPQGLKWKSLSINTIDGRTLTSLQNNGQNQPIVEVGHLPSGLYLVGIETENNVVWKKILKE